MHIDEKNLRSYGSTFEDSLQRKIDESLQRGVIGYYFLPQGKPSEKLLAYGGALVHITFELKYQSPYRAQSMLGKNRIMKDKLRRTEICGWGSGCCVATMIRLMEGEIHVENGAYNQTSFNLSMLLRWWDDTLYRKVMRRKISVDRIEELIK